MSNPTAVKEGTIKNGVEGSCCLCGEHTHSGTPGYKGKSNGIVCAGCLPWAILGLSQ